MTSFNLDGNAETLPVAQREIRPTLGRTTTHEFVLHGRSAIALR